MKALRTLILAAGLASLLAPLSLAPALAQSRMSIATGSSGGVYYLWGGALAKVWSEKIPNLTVKVEATTGQVPNVRLLEAGNLELSMYNVATAYEAWEGLNKYSDRKYRAQRALFTMYPSYYVMVSLADNGIGSIKDWEGKRIAFGTAGGTVDVIGRYILDALSVKPARIVNSGWPDVAGQARDRLIDAIGAIGGQPWPPIKDLETTHKLSFYDFSEAQIQQMRKQYPYFVSALLPARTYQNQEKPYRTLAFWNLVVANKDVSDELVYQIVKNAFANADVLKATHPKTAAFFSEKEVMEVSPVPLHPGAIRYYEERGLKVPDALRP